MLALLEYFWDDTIWGGGGQIPVIPPTDQPSAGGGGYESHDDGFWKIRERYLRQLKARHDPPSQMAISKPTPLPTTIKSPSTTNTTSAGLPPTFDASKLHRYAAELETAIKLASLSKSITELRNQASRIKSLNLAVAESHKIKAAKQQARTRKIKKLKKLLPLLQKFISLHND